MKGVCACIYFTTLFLRFFVPSFLSNWMAGNGDLYLFIEAVGGSHSSPPPAKDVAGLRVDDANYVCMCESCSPSVIRIVSYVRLC